MLFNSFVFYNQYIYLNNNFYWVQKMNFPTKKWDCSRSIFNVFWGVGILFVQKCSLKACNFCVRVVIKLPLALGMPTKRRPVDLGGCGCYASARALALTIRCFLPPLHSAHVYKSLLGHPGRPLGRPASPAEAGPKLLTLNHGRPKFPVGLELRAKTIYETASYLPPWIFNFILSNHRRNHEITLNNQIWCFFSILTIDWFSWRS